MLGDCAHGFRPVSLRGFRLGMGLVMVSSSWEVERLGIIWVDQAQHKLRSGLVYTVSSGTAGAT